MLAGLDRTNSFAWNPHKSLGAPLQCSLFLTRERDLLTRCNSIQVNYLFQQDKFYDVSYDTGNKSIQCGRKIDAFKFWLMLKARGYGSFGRLLDHAIDISKVLVEKIRQRGSERFRLVLEENQYMNVCFWYIPKVLRGLEETPEWRERLYTVSNRHFSEVKCKFYYRLNRLYSVCTKFVTSRRKCRKPYNFVCIYAN